jgi:hypothetical protein
MNKLPDLVLVFAFSLLPDGSPGSYNERLATQLSKHLQESQNEDLPHVALQWEIADALVEIYPVLARELNDQQKLFVIEAPKFTAGEVDEDRLESWLATYAGQTGKVLLDRLYIIEGSSLISRLNKLLDDGSLFNKFPNIEFDNLVRPELGKLFTECREIPRVSLYPNGLRRYQRIRVNRFIVESLIYDQSILELGSYLSTPGVIDTVIQHYAVTGQQFENIQVAAHPMHLPRCLNQANNSFISRTRAIKAMDGIISEEFPWDCSGAQVWCQSLANWSRYEAIVQKWLVSSK